VVRLDKDKLRDVDIVLGESNEQIREAVRSAFRDYGFRRLRTFAHLPELINAIKEVPPDLLIISDDVDPSVFSAVYDIRHRKFGRNPFMMISVMVNAEVGDAVMRAVMAGADDVMIKPVAPGTIMERIAYFTMHRLPFIATNDYLALNAARQATVARPKLDISMLLTR
jgi:DNA-binding response OmpR family regulator